jgi:hypothetical protein
LNFKVYVVEAIGESSHPSRYAIAFNVVVCAIVMDWPLDIIVPFVCEGLVLSIVYRIVAPGALQLIMIV